ncbi:hypothetical protein Vadar_027546 [Vaccinium darrowii]|uniref:Uncharacterized protein n=1 Tax=Vaccinium darrowii TaxID=229202 RepID=A0ACB7YZD8_9ERIC|nr:hypothetical protein Vadar_027546 [Vaccinium darrowii]
MAKVVTNNKFPVMEPKLTSLERHGAEVFSRALFAKFWEEIVAESCLFLLGKHGIEDHCMYEVGKYEAPNSIWTVEYKPCNGIMKCSCLKVESIGFPCRHMISVMKRENLRQIPPGYVLPRWMRRIMEDSHQGQFVCNDSTTITQTARYGMLSSTLNLVSYYASHFNMEFDEVRKVALEMMCQFKKKWETKEWVDDMADKGNHDGGAAEGHVDFFGVGDLVIVRTKGNPGGPSLTAAPRKPRRCSRCRSIGHTKRTCKKLDCRGVKDEDMEEGSEDEEVVEMADDDSADDSENDEEEDNEEEGEEDTDTNTGHPSKKAR